MTAGVLEELSIIIATIYAATGVTPPTPHFRDQHCIIDSESFSFANDSVAHGFRQHADNLFQPESTAWRVAHA